MAKQLNLLGSGQIIPTALHVEMEQSYLEYAMSVIVGRALPDVRDGLKPVHRRILYAMHELGLTPDRPYRKCARVVGDVLGKYHPHGDQAVYDALVRMVQDFSSRYPLLEGHGNFGSVDNDPAAAMRYTETRLAPVAHQGLLSEIGEDTVDFTSNFDNSQQEPVVLPAQLPILLLNGCAGIAVGMATNVPPHNLREVVDGLIALIDKPELSEEKLWKLIPGPDFPTGGELVKTSGLMEAYRTGRGIIPIRGIVHIETILLGKRRRKERKAIVVTELPYQVNKAGWIAKVADLVNQGRLEGISDLRDESDRDGIRVVVELKRDANPKLVLQQLYKQTPLQVNFGIIMLALVDSKPCQLSLRQLLEEFLQFREQTLTRRYRYELEQGEKRLHLVEGLLAALNHLDQVIDILRNAPDGTTARVDLQEQLEMSDAQAESILAMPMRRLTGLERQKLQTESEELQSQITHLRTLLENRHEFLKVLKKELRSLKRKYGNPRRTKIVSVDPKEQQETQKLEKESRHKKDQNTKGKREKSKNPGKSYQSSIPQDAVVEVTHQGHIHWQPVQEKSKPARSVPKGQDFTISRHPIDQQENLVVVLDSGKAYPLAINDIPLRDQKRQTSLLSLLSSTAQRDATRAVSQFFLSEDFPASHLILLTEQGRLKRLAIQELKDLTNRGLSLIKLKDQDRLKYVCFAQEGQELAMATTGGRVLRLGIDDEQIPMMGRSAQGNQGLRLRYGEELAGCASLSPEDNILLVTQLGYVKRLPVSTLRLANRGDIGTQALRFTTKTDHLVGMGFGTVETAQVWFITSNQRIVGTPLKSIPLWGKDGVGEPLSKLKSAETILQVVVER